MSIKKVTIIAKKYIQKIESIGIPVTRVYIFGSQVKGRARYGSDIDLCIISPAFGQDRQKERIMLMNLIPFPPMIFRTNRILLRGKFKKQEFLCNYSRKTVCFRPEKRHVRTDFL